MTIGPRPDSVELILLSVLADAPQYGYAISKLVATRSGGEMRLSPGVLYPLLRDLEKNGLISSEWEEVKSARASDEDAPGRKRRWYKLTAKGHKRLAHSIEAHRSWTSVIESFISGLSGGRQEDRR
jgi:DNA-binding PadR family transcriptional regulator